jgi:hypothetical protein
MIKSALLLSISADLGPLDATSPWFCCGSEAGGAASMAAFLRTALDRIMGLGQKIRRWTAPTLKINATGERKGGRMIQRPSKTTTALLASSELLYTESDDGCRSDTAMAAIVTWFH